MAAMEAANAHYHNGHQQPGPPLPASPTLTNPDMILPDYDRSDSPGPDFRSSEHASAMMWKNQNNPTSAPDMHQMFVATGMAGPHPYGPSGPITPTTPIIYGNGTLLSDIGEVTEVESTAEKPSPGRPKSGSRRSGSTTPEGGKGAAARFAPTTTNAAMPKKKPKRGLNPKHERRSSIDSTSTVTNEDHAAAFPDIDDSVSVGDSVFQGDDEQSMASSYTDGTPAVEPGRLGVAKGDNTDRLSTYSTTSLSRRAEEILANAKKRLTTMEGNLNRARSSLYYNAPYGSDGSTPSPPCQRAASATYPAATGAEPSTPPASDTQGRTRVSSDVSMLSGLPLRVSAPRSQSALGAADGYRQPLTGSRSADHIRGNVEVESHRSVSRTSATREPGRKALTEDEVARLGEADSESQKARIEAFLSPSHDSPSYGSFHSDSGTRYSRRSSSAAQMREIKEIKEQMRDLKGKISSLREQAKADSFKRRSLQGFRTPSPFARSQFDRRHAEPPSNRASVVIAGNAADRSLWNGEESIVDGDVRNAAQRLDNGYAVEGDTDYTDAEERLDIDHEHEPRSLSPSKPAVVTNGDEEEDVSDVQTENGDVDDEQEGTGQEDTFHDADDADYVSESGESLYHDTVQHQISHEDREDAFDYGHFFLHSAMGTLSLERRSSTDSFTSEDSVETTRGPAASSASSDEQRPMVGRRNSGNSISTIDTFTTAQDGRSLKSPVPSDEHYGVVEPSSRATSAQSHRHRSGSTATVKRLSITSATVHPPAPGSTIRDSDGPIPPIAEESSAAGSPAHQSLSPKTTSRRASVVYRPVSAATATQVPVNHRPSISSFDSVGTNRSFPLVNKPRSPEGARKASSTGVLTPRDSPSPSSSAPVPSSSKQDQPSELDTITSRLLRGVMQHAATEAAKGDAVDGANKMSDGDAGWVGGAPRPLEALLREDKYLVDRIVACLGRCVLGLTENGRASAESRMYRRRLDAARRALEGLDNA